MTGAALQLLCLATYLMHVAFCLASASLKSAALLGLFHVSAADHHQLLCSAGRPLGLLAEAADVQYDGGRLCSTGHMSSAASYCRC